MFILFRQELWRKVKSTIKIDCALLLPQCWHCHACFRFLCVFCSFYNSVAFISFMVTFSFIWLLSRLQQSLIFACTFFLLSGYIFCFMTDFNVVKYLLYIYVSSYYSYYSTTIRLSTLNICCGLTVLLLYFFKFSCIPLMSISGKTFNFESYSALVCKKGSPLMHL